MLLASGEWGAPQIGGETMPFLASGVCVCVCVCASVCVCVPGLPI